MQVHDQLFINGAWQPSEGRSVHQVVNPATEEVIAEFTGANRSDVDRAVAGIML